MKKIIGKLTLVTILTGALVIGFLGLVLYNVKDIVFGAPLEINTVANGSTVNDTFLAISGKATRVERISINNRPIGVDKSGNFNDGVILSPGYNIVEVAETDRFGRQRVKTISVVSSPSVSVAQNDVTPYQR